MSDLVAHALKAAYQWHDGQVRKYSGLPYYTHPVAVSAMIEQTIVRQPAWPGWNRQLHIVPAAALLHDVVEDCGVNHQDFVEEFGEHTGDDLFSLVMEVTEVSKPSDGNRAMRKLMDAEHYSQSSPAGATIKLADIIDNAPSIRMFGGDFWKVYWSEMVMLLPRLRHGNELLWATAYQAVHPVNTMPGGYPVSNFIRED